LCLKLDSSLGQEWKVSVTSCESQIGSGALPTETIASAGVAIAPVQKKGAGGKLASLASAFRSLPIPVIGHIDNDQLIFDLRCLDDEQAFVNQLERLSA
jgi:L-seryl-tRNA(Ser) seleniumtransferase